MGRPERPVDPGAGPAAAFAERLRRLRAEAGSPSYRVLSGRARFAPSVLSAAARGAALPSWPVAEGFIVACGGRPEDWRGHWQDAFAALRAEPAPTPVVAAGTAPRTLPPATRAFTGRAAETAALLALVPSSAAAGSMAAVTGTPVVCAIDGMAGVGKTALALHVGHLVSAHFPDGQVFIDLHGFTPAVPRREPADALAFALAVLGVPPARIPLDLEACTAFYRDRLAGTRTLIVLDNAADEAQVRPLLPGSGSCLVLVTSRRRLRALDDSHFVSLGVLPPDDAATLLRAASSSAPADGPAAPSPGLDALAQLCGGLPLALRIVGALVRRRPAVGVDRLANRIRDAGPGLEVFFDGDRDLAAVLGLSHHALSRPAQLLLRRLGLTPGPQVDAYAAAALLAVRPGDGERLLEELHDHSLLIEADPGVYQMHDLIRLYAAQLAGQDSAGQDSEESAAAAGRLLDYYHRTAARADALLDRYRAAAGAVQGDDGPRLLDAEAARAWLRRERANLEACFDQAVLQGSDERLVALGAGLRALLQADGPWSQCLGVQAAALAAAQRLGDTAARAAASAALGDVRRLIGEYEDAARNLEDAAALYRGLGDRTGEALALTQLGAVRYLSGCYLEADAALGEALERFRALGSAHGEARALTWRAEVRRVTGDPLAAVRDVDTALGLFEAAGDRLGQAGALIRLASPRQLTGDSPGAVTALRRALELFSESGDRLGQANALNFLAAVQHHCGELGEAMQSAAQAHAVYRILGDRLGQATSLTRLGAVRQLDGDLPGARRDLDAALRLTRALGDRLSEASALTYSARLRDAEGDRATAMDEVETAIAAFRTLGSRGNVAWALNFRGDIQLGSGDDACARAAYDEAVEGAREAHQPDDEARALEGLAQCLQRAGGFEQAADLRGRALAIWRRIARPADAQRVEELLDPR